MVPLSFLCDVTETVQVDNMIMSHLCGVTKTVQVDNMIMYQCTISVMRLKQYRQTHTI